MTKQKTVTQLFNSFRGRSTRLTKMIGEEIGLMPHLLATPPGNEQFIFDIGQTVITAGTGQIIAGESLEIKDRMRANGFCKYLAGGVWHLQIDLI